MRNLKKILALALVFAMALTFTAGAAADFTDKADITYVDDVNMLVELGVISGYPDGSFGPTKNITRAEFAKMAYTLKYGSDTDGELFAAQKSTFTDVEGNANVKWAKGYINYCANQKIVSGVGNNKFNPQGNITVAEAAKMILVILGCDAEKEGFVGANWAANVTAKAMELGVFGGWSGDPTALATRELVAKFMKNAIFSPIYAYSTLTGIGSQKDAFGNDYETLGEQTMDLNTVTGIVVANENYYIGVYDEDDTYKAVVNGATGANSGDSVIYYEAKDSDGNVKDMTIKIDRALADDMIGAKVSVFFKADYTSEKAIRDYKNVEVIGDVLLHSDTVIYDVPAMLVGIYPDGNDFGKTRIAPYIAFEDEEGEIVKIYADAKFGGFEKNANMLAQNAPESDRDDENGNKYNATAVLKDFGKHAFVSNESTKGKGTAKALAQQANADYQNKFFTDMGEAVISTYRFVSNDGGESYSYIIKMIDQNASNGGAGYVRAYSAAKGTISITNLGTYNTSEVNIIGDVAADDRVVYFRENDILNIVKLEAVTGAVEEVNEDGSAVIGGETYAKAKYGWMSSTYTGVDLAALYSNYKSLLGAETTYYVYNGIVFDIEGASAEAAVEEYAVILASDFDQKRNVAEVTLAFADNTTGTYEVTGFNIQNSANEYASENDKAADFANNAFFGLVVKFELTDGGVDLSANDIGYVVGNSKRELADKEFYENIKYYSNHMSALTGTAAIEDGVFTVFGKDYAALSDSSVFFVIYGNPSYTNEGKDAYQNVEAGADSSNQYDDYSPVKAVAYKMTEKGKQELNPIKAMLSKKSSKDTKYIKDSLSTVSFALNQSKGANVGVIAAAMTIGDGVTDGQIDTAIAEDTGNYAYIVDSAIKRNMTTGKYYMQLTLIDENGLFTAKTVDEVRDMDNKKNKIFNNAKVQRIPAGTDFAAEGFVEYKKDAEGVIVNIEQQKLNIGLSVGNNTEGFYMVNLAYERGDRIYFLDSDKKYTKSMLESASDYIESAKYAEKGYDVIAIDEGDYIGEGLTFISPVEELLEQDAGNAVLQFHEGEVIRVFSYLYGI